MCSSVGMVLLPLSTIPRSLAHSSKHALPPPKTPTEPRISSNLPNHFAKMAAKSNQTPLLSLFSQDRTPSPRTFPHFTAPPTSPRTPPSALRLETDFCSGDQSPRSDAVPLANCGAVLVGEGRVGSGVRGVAAGRCCTEDRRGSHFL